MDWIEAIDIIKRFLEKTLFPNFLFKIDEQPMKQVDWSKWTHFCHFYAKILHFWGIRNLRDWMIDARSILYKALRPKTHNSLFYLDSKPIDIEFWTSLIFGPVPIAFYSPRVRFELCWSQSIEIHGDDQWRFSHLLNDFCVIWNHFLILQCVANVVSVTMQPILSGATNQRTLCKSALHCWFR